MTKNIPILLVIVLSFLVIILLSKNLPLFSTLTLDLQSNKIPFISHNSKVFQNQIGDLTIKSNTLQFLCKSEIASLSSEKRIVTSGGKEITQTILVPSWSGTVLVPTPRSECWSTSLEWGNEKHPFLHGQKKLLHKHVNATFNGDNSFVTFGIELISEEPRDEKGRIIGSTIRNWVTYYGDFRDWRDENRIFIFEVDNSFLSGEWKEESRILRLGSDDKPTLIVTNDLINNMNGELLIKTIKLVTKEERIISIPVTLKKGQNEYKIDLPKETLKGIKTETKISVDFLGVRIFSDSMPKKTFNIIPNLNPEEDLGEFITSVETGAVDIMPYLEPPGKIESTNNTLIVILAVMIFAFMIIMRLIKQ